MPETIQQARLDGLDLLILQALRSKARFRLLRSSVPDEMLSQDTVALLGWYSVYFSAFPEREHIEIDELKSLVQLRVANSSPEAMALAMHLIELLRKPVADIAIQGIVHQLYELDLAGRAAALVARYQNGEEIDLAYELNLLSQKALRAISSTVPDSSLEKDIGEILDSVANDKGLKFRRLTALRNGLLAFQPGASIAVAARPDSGKTSFLAFCCIDFLQQLQEQGDDRPILWLNNEGTAERILPRLYSAALKLDLSQLIERHRAGTLKDEYASVVGNPQQLKLKDMHGATLAQIEQVIEAQRPAIVIADMLGNFHLAKGSTAGNKADAIEQLWQEWREMLVRNNCIGIGTVQISAEGAGMLYPPLSALKDSKTGIQGATDVVLMLGSTNDPRLSSIRGLSTPKNKYQAPGQPSNIQAMVVFDSLTCQFEDGEDLPR